MGQYDLKSSAEEVESDAERQQRLPVRAPCLCFDSTATLHDNARMQMTRREMLSCLALGLGVAAHPAAANPAAKTSATAAGAGDGRPNILLLCIDDLRDWVGYYNSHPGVHTPNIDRLRAQSYSFDRAYCSVPVCVASRGSMLWGLSPATAGLDGIDDAAAYIALTNGKERLPLPLYFSAAGYETISTGKVFHWEKGTARFWDTYQPYAEIPGSFGEHGTFFDYGVLPDEQIHTDQVAADFASAQLKQARPKPWFMAIGLHQPHVPWRVPRWAYDKHPLDKVVLPQVRADDLSDLPDAAIALARYPSGEVNGQPYNQHDMIVRSGLWREHVQAYLAAITHTDAMVGQILQALDKSTYGDNTQVVLWSDHGYHLGEKLHWRKMALWEQATRVPLLIRAPAQLAVGGAYDQPVSLLDLAPTLLDLAGIAAPSHYEGGSLLDLARGTASPRPAEMVWGDAVSTRVGKWRWTRYGAGGQELYDLQADPMEYNNLLGRHGRLEGGLPSLITDTAKLAG